MARSRPRARPHGTHATLGRRQVWPAPPPPGCAACTVRVGLRQPPADYRPLALAAEKGSDDSPYVPTCPSTHPAIQRPPIRLPAYLPTQPPKRRFSHSATCPPNKNDSNNDDNNTTNDNVTDNHALYCLAVGINAELVLTGHLTRITRAMCLFVD